MAMFKKIGQMVKDIVAPSMDGDVLDGQKDSDMDGVQRKLKSLRQDLIYAIAANNDSSDVVKNIIEMDTDNFAMKYSLLDVKDLLNQNNQNVESLQNVVSGLSLIAKYAQLLMKKKDQYKSIPLSNSHVQSKILPMNGNRYILCQLGYSEQTNTTLSFPPNTEPDINIVANLLADMLLFKAEMKYYLSGSHINPQQIDDLMPPSTIRQLKQGDQSGQEALDTSIQSISLENSKDRSNSNETSPYYSAISVTSVKDSSTECLPTEEALPELEGGVVASKVTPLKKDMPGEIATLSEFDVETKEEFENSLRTPSSGFKISCSLCNEEAQTLCKTCMNKLFCENCDRAWHSHPSRRNHVTEKINEMDLTAFPSVQDNIVKGPYGIIAQPENQAALISKKIQAEKLKKTQDAHDGETGDSDGGNMPDFGSIMSGNMEPSADDRNRNNQQQQTRKPLLQTRGGSEDRAGKNWGQNMDPAARGFGPPQTLQLHNQQQHMPLQQQHLPQFLQDNDTGFDNIQHHQHQHPHYHPFQATSLSQSQSPSSVRSAPYSEQAYPHRPMSIQGQQVGVDQFYQGHPPPSVSRVHGQPMIVQGQAVPSVSNVQSVPASIVQGVSYASVQGQPIFVQGQHPYSQVKGGPLRLQMPPTSSPHHFQQFGGSSNNQQEISPGQFYHSPQQLSQPSYYSPPESVQGYKVQGTSTLSGGGDSVVGQPFQQRPYALHTPLPSHPPSQTGHYAGSSVQDSSDKDETFVQHTRRPFMMANRHNPDASCKPTYMHTQNPQTAFDPAPKQSQTYPQLSSSMMAPNEDHVQQKQQQGRPVGQMSSSYSTPSLTVPNPVLRVIQSIKAQPLASSQRLLCSFKIDESKFEIEDLQKEIDELMMEDYDSSSKEIKSRMKKKKDLLKMKKELENVLKEINADDNLVVYYPPSLDSDPGKQQPPSVSPVEKTKSGMRRSPMKVPTHEDVEFPQTVSQGSDGQVKWHQSPQPPNHETNVLRMESVSDNAFHKQSPPIHQMDPPQNSLKADTSVLKSDNKSLPSNLKWHCEHCTFLNEGPGNVCCVCNRTTDNKKFRKEDGDVELVEMENVPKLQEASAVDQKDFVCHKVMNFILSSQQEEEKMMQEKKKAWEEYREDLKKPPTSARKQSPKRYVSDDSQMKSASASRRESGREEMAETAGFSELAGKTDSSGSSNSSRGKPVNASLALERLKEAEACDILKRDGERLIQYMKEADLEGYPVDAVPIAISFSDQHTTSVVEWLHKHWEKNLKKIMKEVADIAQARKQNDIGQLTMVEAQAACIECQGNLKNAVGVCIRKREELFKHLSEIDSYPREEILQVMFTQQGNKENAEQELVKHKLEVFVERIWAKGKGESLNYLMQSVGNGTRGVANPDTCVSQATSALEHDTFQRLIYDTNIDRDRRIRMILVEGKLKFWGRGEMVIDILDNKECNENATLEDIVESVRNCRDRRSALAILQQECQICFDLFPMGKIANLNFCKCKLCTDCLKANFVVVVKEKHVRHWTCPICSLPDMNDEEVSIDYLQMLNMLLSPVSTPDLMSLFEEKVRDFSLQKDPLFRWCPHCGNGFLAEIEGRAMTCNNCRKKTCFTCKRMWEDQHEGLTCEQFEQWKIENDPNNQAIGLARHLEENGIDCPKCQMRYSLAKGGCMHFKCPQCGHEFCSGCYESFNQQGVCKKYKSCAGLGFHCHHPRDCFSFLRDYKVEELQHLLETNKVAFNTQVPEDQEDKKHCPVMEQKEEGIVKSDDKCGKVVEHEMAGLCQSHYKEYLTGLINKHALDPVHLMTAKNMVNLLNRYDMEIPSLNPSGTDQNHRRVLIKVIQEQLPLNRKKLDRLGQ